MCFSPHWLPSSEVSVPLLGASRKPPYLHPPPMACWLNSDSPQATPGGWDRPDRGQRVPSGKQSANQAAGDVIPHCSNQNSHELPQSIRLKTTSDGQGTESDCACSPAHKPWLARVPQSREPAGFTLHLHHDHPHLPHQACSMFHTVQITYATGEKHLPPTTTEACLCPTARLTYAIGSLETWTPLVPILHIFTQVKLSAPTFNVTAPGVPTTSKTLLGRAWLKWAVTHLKEVCI